MVALLVLDVEEYGMALVLVVVPALVSGLRWKIDAEVDGVTSLELVDVEVRTEEDIVWSLNPSRYRGSSLSKTKNYCLSDQ